MGSHVPDSPRFEPPRRHYVPGHVCFRLRSSAMADEAKQTGTYEGVLQSLNDAQLGLDFKSLAPSDGDGGQERLSPHAVFLATPNDGTTAIYKYVIPEFAEYVERDSPEATIDALVALNRDFQKAIVRLNSRFGVTGDNPGTLKGWEVGGITPNWLAVGCQPGEQGPGPAGPPEPVPPPPRGQPAPNWQFRFFRDDGAGVTHGDQHLDTLVDNERRANTPSNVIVAVLDSCPKQDVVDKAVDHFAQNTLLQQIDNRAPKTNGVQIDGSGLPVPTDFHHLEEILPGWLARLDEWYSTLGPQGKVDFEKLQYLRTRTYAMPDHGLFAAGIIKDIAPNAHIHLIPAVDDAGMTDLISLTSMLSLLQDHFLPTKPDDPTRLIVNLSLYFSFPSLDEFVAEWILDNPEHLDMDAIKQLFNLLDRSLKDVFDLFDPRRVLVVASAGNLNRPDTAKRPDPEFPAQYENVFGVAAIDRANQAAAYTNRADVAGSPSNGIATVGGNTTFQGVAQTPVVLKNDAILGIFTAPDLPLHPSDPTPSVIDPHTNPKPRAIGKGTNQTGWGYWAGTSFAAPIITAIAAIEWNRDTNANAATIMQRVQGFADPSINVQTELGCGGIWAEQVLI